MSILVKEHVQPLLRRSIASSAGGANTNAYGKQFEDKTHNARRLLMNGFVPRIIVPRPTSVQAKNKKRTTPFDWLTSRTEDKVITFASQHGLKKYMKHKYNIDLFRCPDEAYIIKRPKHKHVLKILEKKEQCREGSVETKLWSGPSLKREYELMLGDKFVVHYGFCVNDYLKQKLVSSDKKYKTLNVILREHSIVTLFGDDADYFETLDAWLNDL